MKVRDVINLSTRTGAHAGSWGGGDGILVGYARVSTTGQRLDLQMDALKSAGCARIYTDHGRSGFQFDRDGLEAVLNALKPGDTLVVWRLDRLGRSLSGLVNLMEQLGRREIHFRSVMENIDTSSSGGRLMFHMMAALAEFERSVISERTRAGMEVARAGGKCLGRPKALTEENLLYASCAIGCGQIPPKTVAALFGVSLRTLTRHLRETKGSDPAPCASCPLRASITSRAYPTQ